MNPTSEESFGIIPLRQSEGEWSILLILHKQGNHWGYPKGKADDGESPLQSAIRELEEETGLTVEELIQEDPISEEYQYYRRKEKVHKRVHYFPAIVSGALLLQPEEIRDGKWLSVAEAKEQLTFKEAKRVCKHVEEILQKRKA